MRVQGVAFAVVVVGALLGCAAPSPSSHPTGTPSGTPSGEAEIAPVGESAIPLGCSDILAIEDVADLGAESDQDLSLAIHEDRIAVDMTVADLQLGALRCVWAARYGSTDFHAEIRLRIAPTTMTELVPTDEETHGGPPAAVDGDASALIVCDDSFQASDDPALYNVCRVVQLRGGYRIELETSGLRAAEGQDPSVALRLLAGIDAAVDGAGPARVVEPVVGATDPGSLCRAPEIVPLLEHVGATGDPVIEPATDYPGVTRCAWASDDEYGNPSGPWIWVLPGGAWAIPRLGTGVSNIFTPTHPSADGSFVIGNGDEVSAWRAVGDDLVCFVSARLDEGDDWETFLDSTW
jgi:hypothetical protein